MKSTIFTKILNEETITIEASRKETIRRLREQEGVCSGRTSQGRQMLFRCSKKGKMIVEDFDFRHSIHGRPLDIYNVWGEVLVRNGETLVKIYCFYSRFVKYSVYFIAVFYFLWVLAVIALKMYAKLPITKNDIFEALVMLGGCIVTGVCINKEKHNHRADLKIMKEEIVQRVHAVDYWEEE